MIKAKIETRELLDFADLTRAQTLCIYELLTVVKTDEDGSLAWRNESFVL